MKENMGQIIKRLRKERNLTQEELAEQLNISAQAISKWENGTSMPDISQVVPLANLFGVPTDVLFGVYGTNVQAEVEAALDEIFRMQENVLPEEQARVGIKILEKYREALKRFPNNSTIMCNAICFAGMLIDNDGEELKSIFGENGLKDLKNERVRWAELVIKYSTDQDDILCAKRNLMEIYAGNDDWEKAFGIAESFPKDIYNISSIRLAELKWQAGKTEEQQELHCQNIRKLTETLGHQVFMLGNSYMNNGNYEEALNCYTFMHNVINSLYVGDEYHPPFHDKGYPLYKFPAFCLVKLGRYEEAVVMLEKCLDYYQAQAKYFNKTQTLNSPLLRNCVFSYGYNGTAKYKDPVKAAKHIICDKAFLLLNEQPRYKALLKKVNNM